MPSHIIAADAPLLVAVADSVFPNLDLAREVLSAIGADVQLAAEPTTEAILAVAGGADALLVTYAKITADMIAQMKQCRIISRFGIGVDNVDLAAATAAAIVVTKVPDYCIDEVSDHAVALLLALVRKIPLSNAHVHAGRWEMKAVVPIHRLRGTVLGLVGFGRIPQLVAPKAKAFGIRVMAFDPMVPADVFASAGVERVDFADLLKQADYVSIHTPLLPETRSLSTRRLRSDERAPILVNTARADRRRGARASARRGPAGRRGPRRHAAGAAGRLAASAARMQSRRTPAYSEESLLELQRKAAEEVVAVLSGRPPRNAVNPKSSLHVQPRREPAADAVPR